MKIAIGFLVLMLVCPGVFGAENTLPQEKRRVEEEKRQSLKPSEALPKEPSRPLKEKPAALPLDQFNPDDIIYFGDLATRKIAYRYDICKALVLLLKLENEFLDLNAQASFLKENGYIPKKYSRDFDTMLPLRRGITSYMFCKALGIKGGLILRLAGLRERYAMKELAFAGILSEGNVNDIISGEELIAILSRAADYLAEKRK